MTASQMSRQSSPMAYFMPASTYQKGELLTNKSFFPEDFSDRSMSARWDCGSKYFSGFAATIRWKSPLMCAPPMDPSTSVTTLRGKKGIVRSLNHWMVSATRQHSAMEKMSLRGFSRFFRSLGRSALLPLYSFSSVCRDTFSRPSHATVVLCVYDRWQIHPVSRSTASPRMENFGSNVPTRSERISTGYWHLSTSLFSAMS
mmetsp:Transcript_31214/g.61788  ORF Transcript_31214/g.61788 Transcript_31214/m.61788 type:complete len:201 (+) Transcript_31214:786-1388(+)